VITESGSALDAVSNTCQAVGLRHMYQHKPLVSNRSQYGFKCGCRFTVPSNCK